jgi:predicted nucleotidyltransferase
MIHVLRPEARSALCRIVHWIEDQGLEPFEVWLFGSHARNESHPHSDLDVLVVLPEEQLPTADALGDSKVQLIEDVLAAEGELLQLVWVGQREWTMRGTPLVRNVARTGIRIQ